MTLQLDEVIVKSLSLNLYDKQHPILFALLFQVEQRVEPHCRNAVKDVDLM